VRTLLLSTPLSLAFVVLWAGHAAAQGPAPTAPPAAPTGAEPPKAANLPNLPGARITTGQAPVVGGNAAGARERALDDALRQAVDQTIDDLIDPQTRAAQMKTIRALETKARSYVGSYRTLEEGETGGIYTVRVEAEVDRVAVRNRLERGTAPAGPATAGRSVIPPVVVLPGEGATSGFAAAVAGALSAAGLRARTGAPPAPASGASATVSATTTDEGPLRGTGRVSVACRGVARFAGVALPERAAATRAFAEDASAGRVACLDRLASSLATEMASALASVASPTADLPVLTIDADVVEPAAVAALLKSVRAVGAVSSADLVRVGGGHAEIHARTRSASAPLAAALSRDVDTMISLSDVQASGAVIKLRARLRTPAGPETGSNP
jgi:hypothetical protein